MSTVSGTTDVSVKYQRLAAEFVKLRSQLNVLKTAVIDEKGRNEQLRSDILAKDSELRKTNDENESLQFRNAQLVKRVEALQKNLDEVTKLQLAKGKKKQRDANLRLFVNLDESENNSIPGPSNPNNTRLVLEQELERKVQEISNLHSKIFDLEQNNRKEVDELTEQINQLKKDNARLKSIENERKTNQNQSTAGTESEYKCQSCHNNVRNGAQNHVIPEILSSSTQAIDFPISHDARLYADGLVNVSKSFLTAFSTIFTLLEQRSVLYPFDINLEVLPESFRTFGQEMVAFSSDFQAKINKLDAIQEKINESDDLQFLDISAKKMWPEVCQSFKLVNSYLQNSLIVILRAENEVPFCNSDLEELNLKFEQHFLIFIKNLIDLLSKPLSDLFQLKFRHIFVDRLSHLQSLIEELDRLFQRKIMFEKGIPTASKRLKCVNECISKAFEQIAVALSRAFGMISDSNALEYLRMAINGEIKPILEVKLKEDGDHQEKKLVREDSIVQTENEKLVEDLKRLNIKLDEAVKEKAEWQATVHAMEHELDVLRNLRDEQTRAADLADPNTKLNQDQLEKIYKGKIKQLSLELTFAKGEAMYYKEECDSLLITAKTLQKNYSRLNEPCSKCESLNEALLATQFTFEEQMRELYDKLAEQEDEISFQREAITKFKTSSASTSPMSSTDQTPPRENSFRRNIRRMVGK
ncbi:unnamed protein product [Bursaphelenchus xylophilus]|uniref:Protein phosphatase 1 regulatory subunit 21 n=1 Tax=Bursaphelenchus xylophilus TaxID=6326 RepID=A0A1I7RNY0_BURXY|nr:unnamed protein product [Bursaphelenchus xylophilus]CAG9124376.1 unnamed protein product [Bursaphelenchus xylophilus]